jgi:hypothetical protein
MSVKFLSSFFRGNRGFDHIVVGGFILDKTYWNIVFTG